MERGSPVDRENVVARENLEIAPFEVFRNEGDRGERKDVLLGRGLRKTTAVLSGVYRASFRVEEIDESEHVSLLWCGDKRNPSSRTKKKCKGLT